MKKTRISSEKIVEHPGPHPGYSKAILVESPTRWLFISGAGPLDSAGNIVGIGDIEAQTRQTFLNIKALLDEVGADFTHLVKMTYYLADPKYAAGFRKVRIEFLKEDPPAATLINVNFHGRQSLLEVEGIAAF